MSSSNDLERNYKPSSRLSKIQLLCRGRERVGVRVNNNSDKTIGEPALVRHSNVQLAVFKKENY